MYSNPNANERSAPSCNRKSHHGSIKLRRKILTPEERNVLVLTAPHPYHQYLSNTEIGKRLGIPTTRVKTLIHRICLKLGASNRMEALFFALLRREVKLNEVYSLDELAEICRTICPDMFRRITHLVSKGIEYVYLAQDDEQINCTNREDKRRDTILTSSERDVIILVGRGLTNREIADKLFMSVNSINTFLYRAYTKLGAHKRPEAVQLALKRGEISMDDIYSIDELLQSMIPLGTESLGEIAQVLSDKPDQEPAPAVS